MRAWNGLAVLAAVAVATAAASERPPLPVAPGANLSAELSANDLQRPSGKYEDVYLLQGRRGDRFELSLASEDFDTFLLVSGPQGFSLSNDDRGSDDTNSRLILELPADGTYRIAATSFRPGESGLYSFEVTVPAASATASTHEPAEAIEIGSALTGHLSRTDRPIAGGEFSDRYRFRASRGQRVTASLSSSEFDTYLILRRPDGSQEDNDDIGGESTDSRIDTVLAEDGDYDLVVTSYRAGATGKYRLSLFPSPGHPRHVDVPGGPRVIALLVGVADYGGRTSPLPNTDEDARRLYSGLRDSGLLHPASRLLTNGEATTKNVAAAFRQAAAQAGPDDVFLFFFSGHGDQLDTERSTAELDGRIETIELFDSAMTDAQLGQLFALVNSRLALVAIDACYAGGFRNLIDRPNVMGLFSSEEDLTSLVASQFKAGGFLAYFLRTGLGGEADNDGDRIVTAGELSTFVRRRFRREGDIPAHTRENEANFQNLVIERGGVHVDDVVVRLGIPARSAGYSAAQAAVVANRTASAAAGEVVD